METNANKFTVHALQLRENNIDLEPGFQRGKVWKSQQKQKFLDSIYKNWPTPKIFLRVTDEKKEIYQCIDGQQRLRTIFEFLNGNIFLSKDFFPKEYDNYSFAKLPPAVKEKFTEYGFNVDIIKDDRDDIISEFYLRLNQGIPINSSEKLKSIGGKMKDFVWDLSKNNFINTKTSVKNTRDSFVSICAQSCYLEIYGTNNLKFSSLEKMFSENKDFNENSKKAQKIKKVFEKLDKIFDKNTSEIKNRASIVSLYLLVSSLIEKSAIEGNESIIKDFFIAFQNELDNNKEKDSELMVYQNSVIQAQDSKTSIIKRNDILIRRLCAFDKTFKHFFPERKISKIIFEREKDGKNLVLGICESMEEINKRINLFKQNNLRVAKISVSCPDLKTYNLCVQELNNWIDEIDTIVLKKSINKEDLIDSSGNNKKSIQLLESYLKITKKDIGKISENLRKINLLAKSFARHSGKELEGKKDELLKELGINPSKIDYEILWEKTLVLFSQSLQELEQSI